MKIINEFKEFALRGNMIEMAVGIVIGASFNSVVDSLVKNILLPPLSMLSQGINFQEKKIILRKATESYSEVSIEYGLFINNIVDFAIVGFTIFLVIKLFNSLRKKSEDISDKSVETPKQISPKKYAGLDLTTKAQYLRIGPCLAKINFTSSKVLHN